MKAKNNTHAHHIACSLLVAGISAVIFFFIGSCYYYYSPFYKNITHAVALLQPTLNNQAFGIIHFVEESDGVRITAQMSGLTPGNHAFHVHEFGDCACDDGMCAGEHFNPTNASHGSPEDSDRHVGDFGNITADEEGNAYYEYIDTYVTLNGPHSIIGRSIIVHADEDDFVSQPSGNSGGRIACGVIGIANPENFDV